MNLFRNILTAIWCAIVIGTNVFALILTMRVHGLDVVRDTALMLPLAEMSLLAVFGLLALVSTKFLWAVFAVAAITLLLSFTQDILTPGEWGPTDMLGRLFLIVPTYLLARWNTVAQRREFNPVKEF